jgi:hypothetical protein
MYLLIAALTFAVGRTVHAQPTCVGDCNGNGTVAINELIIGVRISLEESPLEVCPVFDVNDSGTVAINELILGVNNSLNGCMEPVVTLRAQRVAVGPSGIDDPIWSGIRPLQVEMSNMSTGLVYGDGQMNMTGTFAGLDGFNGGDPADLEMRAVHDGTDLYILAEWNDVNFNLDRRRWLYNGPLDPLKAGESADGWTSQLNDDKIGFAFEIDAASSEFGPFATAGCAASCHNVDGGGLDMRPAAGKVDIWHWKTSRSEPLGYVDDQISDAIDGRRDDAADVKIENRNRPSGGTNRSGPDSEWDGTLQEFERWDGQVITLDPAYILLDGHRTPFVGDADAGEAIYATGCAGCHGNLGQGGNAPALDRVSFSRVSRDDLSNDIADSGHIGSGAFTSLSMSEQNDLLARLRGMSGIPGYYLTPPEGSVADIVTQSNVDYTFVTSSDLMRTHYTLLMIRALNTGNDDDAQFAPGSEYPFGVALMDNDGRNHIGSRREALVIDP